LDFNRQPTVPALVSPLDNSTVLTSRPTFKWTASIDPDGDTVFYEIAVDDNIDFSSLEISVTNITMTNYTPTINLSDGKYYWRIRAYDEKSAYSNWSIARGVIINTTIINRPPEIKNFNPKTNPTIKEGESITFNITPYDPDGITPTIIWKLNGSVVCHEQSYTFIANYTSAGIYTVNVSVTDGEFYTSHQWTLTVVDVTVITPKVEKLVEMQWVLIISIIGVVAIIIIVLFWKRRSIV
ncbi:MAG: PKD domain-containing protein, partial [Candidatus Thermoplasmatota archaeon]